MKIKIAKRFKKQINELRNQWDVSTKHTVESVLLLGLRSLEEDRTKRHVMKGIMDAKHKPLKDLGSFTTYLEDEGL